MSRSIWTPCGGASNQRPLSVEPWRVVESQHVNSTRKLVDSDEEQGLLEELIDSVKPPAPAGPGFRGLHYLLFTPFRHPPLRDGSRFGTRFEPGIFYASLEKQTAFAEVAYYRLLFFEGTSADLGLISVELSAFQSAVRTTAGVDLTRKPFEAHTDEISSRTRYDTSQRLGREMRETGVIAFLFRSARDPGRGTNLGLFHPAFVRKRPRTPEGWLCNASIERVELRSRNPLSSERHRFLREDFLVDGLLPAPAA